jgi:hypothetical protein
MSPVGAISTKLVVAVWGGAMAFGLNSENPNSSTGPETRDISRLSTFQRNPPSIVSSSVSSQLAYPKTEPAMVCVS